MTSSLVVCTRNRPFLTTVTRLPQLLPLERLLVLLSLLQLANCTAPGTTASTATAARCSTTLTGSLRLAASWICLDVGDMQQLERGGEHAGLSCTTKRPLV